MDHEPKLPFTDQDMRDAEQYALDLEELPQPQPEPAADYVRHCTHNCNACPHCDNR